MDILSEEGGRCTRVAADIGDTIGKDGVFAMLDKTFIDLAIAENRVDQGRVENRIAYYAKEVRRYERLVGRKTAAQSTLDELRNKLDQSEFELQALKVEEANLKERRERHLIRVPPGWTSTE
jgi:multidrug resistance efflux pump